MPIAAKAGVPAGGNTMETLRWASVRSQLEEAKHYRIASNRTHGSPHAVPVDGLWVGDVWYYGASGRG